MALTGDTAYRDASDGLAAEREELLAQRRRELEAMPAAVLDVYARRTARVVTGLAGIGLAGLAAACALAGIEAMPFVGVAGLVGLPLLAMGARAVGRARVRRRLAVDFGPSGDVRADVDRLIRDTPLAVVRRMADAHEPWSVVLAAASLAVVVPLVAQSAIFWLMRLRGIDPPMPAATWNRAILPECAGVVIILGVMTLLHARNVRLRTVRELMAAFIGSNVEAWATAILAGSGWALMAVGSRFMQPAPGGHVGVIQLSDTTSGDVVASFAIWGSISVWFVMYTIARPIFAIVYRRVQAERTTLGLSADDFLRRQP